MRMQSLTLALVLLCAPSLVSAEEPTPEHVKMMKEIGGLSGKIRKGEDVEASAKRMAELGKDVGAFWNKRSDVAAQAAKDFVAAAGDIASAAASNNADAVGTAGKKLGGSCRSCHDAHREKISDNVYKIK